MHLKLLLLSLLLLIEISFSYEIHKNYDQVRNYQAKQQPRPKVIKVKSGDSKIKKYKRDHSDNVKGELKPKSRAEIYNIKKLSFHGRNSPNAEPLVGENTTYYYQNPEKFTTTSKPMYSKPIQRNDYYIPVSQHKSSNPIKKSVSPSVENQVITPESRYVPHSEKFHPLMKPSPINVMPTEPPSFDTIRNYVSYLKMRRNKFFSDFEDDDVIEEEKPIPVLSLPKISIPFGGEIDYFKEREKELAREEHLRNQFSPDDFGQNDRISEVDLPPYQEIHDENVNNESEITSSNKYNGNVDDDDDSIDEEEIDNNASKSIKEGQEYYDGREDYDDGAEEESRKKENFVPFRLYAQVRHMEADHHEEPNKKNIKEKISLAKKNIYYKEEGYEDKQYDHGDDKINYNFDEKIKDLTPHKNIHLRVKRAATNVDESFDVSKLPIALAYIKKSELPKLTGAKLLKHLDELLKNSSVYLDDDDNSPRPVKITKPKSSQKFPNYNAPETVLSQMSAHRYSENLKNYPHHKESLYKFKNIKQCDEIEEDIYPVPIEAETEHKRTKFNNKPKRLNGLGDKIQCLREKYFGDPFENPLFHEDEYVEATIPIPVAVNHNLSRQANPLITVYDDVINNIRSGFLDEFKKKREAEDALKVASEQISVKAEQTIKIPNFSAVNTVGSNFPLFDINNFLPKFKGTINHDLIDDLDNLDDAKLEEEGSAAAELLKINKQQLLLENDKLKNSQYKTAKVTEKPKVKRNNKHINSDFIEDISPPLPPTLKQTTIRSIQAVKSIKTPQLSVQKHRRFIPNNIPYQSKHISTIYLPQKPATKTTYRFKLL
ncbi:hypothetical protein PVAND_005264 [Polypedilum vanderplanki]|uniref:Uncharacterized protein n=1 Tax=Polypedilum vanderplanki TaxID=319348 RepID=A0A9J6C0L2_POLVA|nr:hypothetical protein PVAND_005264 [Polypedilum vanderplanki]